MAITAVGTPTVDAGNRTTPHTFSHTVNASADALTVKVATGYEDAEGDTPGSVAMTYGGVAMTLIAGPYRNATKNTATWIWLILAPSTGANNVVCTWAGGGGGARLAPTTCVHSPSALHFAMLLESCNVVQQNQPGGCE